MKIEPYQDGFLVIERTPMSGHIVIKAEVKGNGKFSSEKKTYIGHSMTEAKRLFKAHLKENNLRVVG